MFAPNLLPAFVLTSAQPDMARWQASGVPGIIQAIATAVPLVTSSRPDATRGPPACSGIARTPGGTAGFP